MNDSGSHRLKSLKQQHAHKGADFNGTRSVFDFEVFKMLTQEGTPLYHGCQAIDTIEPISMVRHSWPAVRLSQHPNTIAACTKTLVSQRPQMPFGSRLSSTAEATTTDPSRIGILLFLV